MNTENNGHTCVFHTDIKDDIEKIEGKLEIVKDDTLINTSSISSLNDRINKLSDMLQASKAEFRNKLEDQRKEFVSFCKWLAVFIVSVVSLIFGLVQWLLK